MVGTAFFRRTCLKPSHSLRRQLLLSFGSASFVAITIVVSLTAFTAYRVRKVVNGHSDHLFREQVTRRLVRNSGYVTETLATYFENIHSSIQLMTEIVQDRIVGYPDLGWEEDLHVPFMDRETGTNKYPLNSTHLLLDWQFIPNVNSDNIEEHFPDREHTLESYRGVTASHPYYFTPGVCDPLEVDPLSPKYYHNCSDNNNAIISGGGWNPSPTNRGLYEKAADIGVFLKPIFEAELDISAAGVFFVNSGASSMVQYPAAVVGAMVPPYVSDGCDWMRYVCGGQVSIMVLLLNPSLHCFRETNPRSGKPFGTEDDIARCPPVGHAVLPREYNPNARGWYQKLATNPHGISWQGPLLTNLGIPIYTVGQGIFDRK